MYRLVLALKFHVQHLEAAYLTHLKQLARIVSVIQRKIFNGGFENLNRFLFILHLVLQLAQITLLE